MTALLPSLAADIANGVYGIKTVDNLADAFVSRNVGGLERHFDVSRARIVQGVSGTRLISRGSGFGLVMPFRGARSGQCVVAIRGTMTGFDWLSNLQMAATSGPNGQVVHAGFKHVYDSVVDGVLASLRGTNPAVLHVLGHSLGGAVANLLASRLAADGVAEIQLYTFGAPRTGYAGYAQDLTRTLKAANIHRVYSISDVVPMVPLFPFFHAPSDSDGYRLRTPHGPLSINAHYMSSYTPGVAGEQWASLATKSAGVESQLSVDYWLKLAGQHVAIPGLSLAFFAIGKALSALLDLIRVTLGLALTGGLTLLDQLAALLHRAASLSRDICERVLQMLALALRFAGQAAVTGVKVTTVFITWVLGMLMRPVLAIGNAAMETFDS